MTVRNYIGVIHKDADSDYGVSFPDFLGCITTGKTLDEAQRMANQALQAHIDWMVSDNDTIPESSKLESIKANAEYKDAEAFLIVSARLPTKATRINITVDEGLLRKFDRYLEQHGETRSAYIAHAMQKTLSSEGVRD